jgi:OPT oligopeptide transporter protein
LARALDLEIIVLLARHMFLMKFCARSDRFEPHLSLNDDIEPDVTGTPTQTTCSVIRPGSTSAALEMAPDRGSPSSASRIGRVVGALGTRADTMDTLQPQRRRSDARKYLSKHAPEGQGFTARGVAVGIGVGVIICFSNMYFGLQTGWISGMTMPSSLIGFSVFKTVARHLSYPFTPVENVLVQTVAGAVGTMPLACGFVGVMPALQYLLTPSENGPVALGIGKLVIWSLGLCFFGVVFAVPLRREVIIRERLKFPSGTATALMIGVLHGESKKTEGTEQRDGDQTLSLIAGRESVRRDSEAEDELLRTGQAPEEDGLDGRSSWKAKVKLLVYSFAISAFYVRTLIECATSPVCSGLMSWYVDARVLFHPYPPRPSSFRPPACQRLALGTEPFTRICRSRYYHGAGNDAAYAIWCYRRLGCVVAFGQEQRLGSRTR